MDDNPEDRQSSLVPFCQLGKTDAENWESKDDEIRILELPPKPLRFWN
jgi:hypothetical protein